MSLLLWGDDAAKGADISFNGPILGIPYSLSRLGFTYTRNSPKTVYQNNALVTLSANQFGTTYDSVTGLHAFEDEPAATNLLINSVLAGGGAAPTGWAQDFGTGTSAPASSVYGDASGAIAYAQSATGQRPYFTRNVTLSANTTYVFSMIVESISGTLIAADILAINGAPVGSTVTYPVCPANPLGGVGALTTGVLTVTIAVAATAGTIGCRIGIGGSGARTGTIQFSRPQFETGVRRTSWIATTTGTVTRAADVLSCPVANIPGFSAAGYTLSVDWRLDVAGTGTPYLIQLDDGSASNRACLRLSPTVISSLVSSGGASSAAVGEIATGVVRNKSALSCALNSFLRAVNGVAGTADTLGAMPVGLTTLRIGCNESSVSQLNGLIFGFKLIPVALNQAQTNGQT